MLFHDLLPPNFTTRYISTEIYRHCGQFLKESGGIPLYKSLPLEYDVFKRVKVRFQKRTDTTSHVFENVFGDGKSSVGIRERAVVASGEYPSSPTHQTPFYIFPLDGYKFLFSPQVKNSAKDFGGVLNTLIEQFDSQEGTELTSDLIKYAYQSTNLKEGISSMSELIIYNIPVFYAVNALAFPDYNKIITPI